MAAPLALRTVAALLSACGRPTDRYWALFQSGRHAHPLTRPVSSFTLSANAPSAHARLLISVWRTSLVSFRFSGNGGWPSAVCRWGLPSKRSLVLSTYAPKEFKTVKWLPAAATNPPNVRRDEMKTVNGLAEIPAHGAFKRVTLIGTAFVFLTEWPTYGSTSLQWRVCRGNIKPRICVSWVDEPAIAWLPKFVPCWVENFGNLSLLIFKWLRDRQCEYTIITWNVYTLETFFLHEWVLFAFCCRFL